MNTASDIYLQRIRERDERREQRRETEKRIHDEYLAGTPRSMRAAQFANQVLGLLGKFIPDACRSEAYDELVLQAFQMDVEITPVSPDRDAKAKAALDLAMLAPPRMIVPTEVR